MSATCSNGRYGVKSGRFVLSLRIVEIGPSRTPGMSAFALLLLLLLLLLGDLRTSNGVVLTASIYEYTT